MDHQRWIGPSGIIGHGGDNAGAGLDLAHAIEDLEWGHADQPGFLVGLVVPEARPGLQPTFTGQVQAQWAGRIGLVQAIKIHRQHVADGCAQIVAFLEGFHAAEH